MNKQELVQILTILGSNYQSIGRQLEDDAKRKIVYETWWECIGDLDYKLALASVKKSMITNSYPPTIHDIRCAALNLTQGEEVTPIEYWNEAFKMIKCGTYMTKEEFESHSDIVKRFFGDVGQVKELARTNLETVTTVTKGQFLKQIETLKAREKEKKMLPKDLQKVIAGISNNLLLEG